MTESIEATLAKLAEVYDYDLSAGPVETAAGCRLEAANRWNIVYTYDGGSGLAPVKATWSDFSQYSLRGFPATWEIRTSTPKGEIIRHVQLRRTLTILTADEAELLRDYLTYLKTLALV